MSTSVLTKIEVQGCVCVLWGNYRFLNDSKSAACLSIHTQSHNVSSTGRTTQSTTMALADK